MVLPWVERHTDCLNTGNSFRETRKWVTVHSHRCQVSFMRKQESGCWFKGKRAEPTRNFIWHRNPNTSPHSTRCNTSCSLWSRITYALVLHNTSHQLVIPENCSDSTRRNTWVETGGNGRCNDCSKSWKGLMIRVVTTTREFPCVFIHSLLTFIIIIMTASRQLTHGLFV